MNGNIVKNSIKYCQTSKITVVFIHKTCNKVKSMLQSASLVLIEAFKAANLQLEMGDYGII